MYMLKYTSNYIFPKKYFTMSDCQTYNFKNTFEYVIFWKTVFL